MRVEAEDGGTVEVDQATEAVVDGPVATRDADVPEPGPEAATATATDPIPDADPNVNPDQDSAKGSDPDPASAPDSDSNPDTDAYASADPDPDPDPDSELLPDGEPSRGRRPLPVATGIGCAALLLPLIAVAGAILCFAAGILSAATGCKPNGSALCSANGPWLAFALPLFVSPLIAAGTAIGAVTVRRHRSTWLAVGYGVVFISVIVGLASASTGSG